jgi:hypothetical protein
MLRSVHVLRAFEQRQLPLCGTSLFSHESHGTPGYNPLACSSRWALCGGQAMSTVCERHTSMVLYWASHFIHLFVLIDRDER